MEPAGSVARHQAGACPPPRLWVSVLSRGQPRKCTPVYVTGRKAPRYAPVPLETSTRVQNWSESAVRRTEYSYRVIPVSEGVPEEPQSLEAQTTFTELEREVSRRRTFAIISHPDAGKTTLTEKLLLYAGAIELAGAVRGRNARRHATSDWMELEQQRGISITSAALEFELEGRRMSLLDTPGHNDFSEDTYRALMAADSVVMVIDAAHGVQAQTRKLFDVCRRHRLPILTFVNKLDRPSRDPLELLDDLERTLGIAAAPVNWPAAPSDFAACTTSKVRRCVGTNARRRDSIGCRSTCRRWTIRKLEK